MEAFRLNRFLVFCFYDKQGIADDYVFYFLEKIKPFCNEICIVINGTIDSNSEGHFKKYTEKILKRENEGFDSGAFKHVINTLGLDYLRQFDEVIFANDTFYGPLFDLEELFTKMESEPADFWGITKHPAVNVKINGVSINEHVQSYFIAYKKNILISKDFEEYWNNLRLPVSYDEAVVFYELYTTNFFANKGYKYSCFIDIKPGFYENELPYFYDVNEWIEKNHLPFIKKKIFEMDKYFLKHNIKNGVLKLIDIIEKDTDYDKKMILSNVERLYSDFITRRYSLSNLLNYLYIFVKRILFPRRYKHYTNKLNSIKRKIEFLAFLKENKKS